MRKVALFILASTIGIAASNTHLKPVPLRVSGARASGVPIFPWFGLPRTDEDGDLFFHVGAANFNDATILKLSHSSFEPTLYKLPADIKSKYSFDEFTVTPSGVVWMLANSIVPELMAVEFNGNGDVRTKTVLEVELNEVDIHGFSAMTSGPLVIAGTYTGKAAPRLRGRSFLALFDSNTGKRIRELLDTFPAIRGSKEQLAASMGEMVTGDDGNIYMLHGSQIIVVGPGGEVRKRISFKKPDSGLLAMQVRVSAGAAAVWLGKLDSETQRVDFSFLVLDLTSGRRIGWYVAPAGLEGQAIGFSRDNGVQFLQRKQGNFEMVTTELY